MAPIKFEEDMKDRLEKRTINPSAKSWNTLSQRLDNEENKSSKKGFWWLGIAASIIGVLLVYNMFINSTTSTKTVITEENTIIIKTPKQIIKPIKREVVVKNEEIKIQTNYITSKKPQSIKNIANNTNQTAKEKTKTVINNIKIKEPIVINNNSVKKEILMVSVENQTNSIITVENKTSPVTDNEINALLAKATKDIAMQKTESITIPIDYNGLLLDVEDDLDESVRDKMLKVVKRGYETLRESVAERND